MKKPPACGNNKYIFDLWHLDKVGNNLEYNMIEHNGKTWYWCNGHCYNNKGVVTNGMYVTHKPHHHYQWRLKKENLTNHRKGKNISVDSAPATNEKTKSASTINDSAASKLSLSKSLQTVLITTAGLSESQFNKIWVDACSTLGNCMALNVGLRINGHLHSSYHILNSGCHFYPITPLHNLFYTYGQDIHLLLIRHYSRALPMDTLLIMDCNFELHRTFWVDGPSDHLCCTNYILHFLLVCLWFWSKTLPSDPLQYYHESCPRSGI